MFSTARPRATLRRRGRATTAGTARARRAARRASGARRRRARSGRRRSGRTRTGCSTPCSRERVRRAPAARRRRSDGVAGAGLAIDQLDRDARAARRSLVLSPRPAGSRRGRGPSAVSATCGHLLGELEVGIGARAVRVVMDHRAAEARRLADPDVARDHGVEDERREVRRAPRARRRARGACGRRASSAASPPRSSRGLSSRWISASVSSSPASPSSAKYSVCTGNDHAVRRDERVDGQRARATAGSRRACRRSGRAAAPAHRAGASRSRAARGSSTDAPARSGCDGSTAGRRPRSGERLGDAARRRQRTS